MAQVSGQHIKKKQSVDNSAQALRREIQNLQRDIHSLQNEGRQRYNQFINFLRDAPWKQNNTSNEPQSASTQEYNRTDWQPPLSAHVPPTPSDSNQSEKPRYKTMRGWKTLLEVVAIPFAIAYAIITGLMWHDMERQTRIADRSLHVSERAYISFGLPVLDIANKTVSISVVNTGHLPAKFGDLKSYTAVSNSTTPDWSTFARGECHVHETVNLEVTPGDHSVIMKLVFRGLDRDKIMAGRQKLTIQGAFTFNDGFPDDPLETRRLCLESVYHPALHEIEMSSCNPGDAMRDTSLFQGCEDDGNYARWPGK